MNFWEELLKAFADRFKLEVNEVKQFFEESFHKLSNKVHTLETDIINTVEGTENEKVNEETNEQNGNQS